MGTRIDLTQFWNDHPEYVGKDKEFGIVCSVGNVPANSTGTTIVVSVPETLDFIACAALCVPFNAGTVVATAGPSASNIQLPNSTWLVNMSAQQQSPNSRTFESTTWLLNGFKVSWDWPYPLVFRAGSNITLLYDNPIGNAMTVNIAFHGIKVFPYDVPSFY